MEQSLGLAHFLAQQDAVGRVLLIVLLCLSVASWYLILTKGVTNVLERRRADRFLTGFWQADSLASAAAGLDGGAADNAFACLLRQTVDAVGNGQHEEQSRGLTAAGGLAELVTRVLRNGTDQEAARVENGLTILASAGSAAPYIGLFGTVWGIYHALVQIGLSGQGTLDKVAGPVGEALIMTALGLAVAIPAVLAYNSFSRRNRLWLSRLDAFAHDLYVLATVGSRENGTSRLNGEGCCHGHG
ncbi:MAG: biopolymer transporter ExbB [Desulfobulbaceae bacterium A2]|nr:MAG: biopolymer transporter ExbB [Desulfobulbaceae bacterium A2]